MNNGFLMLARSFFQHHLWKQKRAFSPAEAFLDLVQSAPFEPQKRIIKGHVVEVPRGGIVASERFLSDRWMWSRNKVRLFLETLTIEGMIRPQKDHKQDQQKDQQITAFLLCNFDRFNPAKDQQKDQLDYQKRTSEGPPKDQIEKGKEGNTSVEGTSREFPPWEHVKAYAITIGLAEWKALDWFDEMESCGWLDWQSRPVRNWQASIRRVKTKWEAAGRPAGPTGANGKPAAPKSKYTFVQPLYDDEDRMIRDAHGRNLDPATGKIIP